MTDCPRSPANDYECQREPKPHDGAHENYDMVKRWYGNGSLPWARSDRWIQEMADRGLDQ